MAEVHELILQVLSEAGIQMDESQKKAVIDAAADVPLAIGDRILQPGQIAVDESWHKSRGEDLKKWKERAREAEAGLKQIQDDLNSGTSTEKRIIEDLKKKIDRLEPQNKMLMDAARDRWKAALEAIPDRLKGKFKIPGEDEDGLSDEDLLRNLSKYDEYADLGLFSQGNEDPPEDPIPDDPPPIAPVNTKGKGRLDKDLSHLSIDQRMAAGYKPMPHESKP